MWDMVYYFLGVILLIVVAVKLATIYQLLGIRFQRVRFEARDATAIPAYLQEVYSQYVAPLTTLGFTVSHAQFSRDIVSHARDEKWSLLLRNSASQVIAELSPASTFLDLPGAEVTFWSVARDGQALMSVNGRAHMVLGGIPDVEIHDPLVTTLADHYSAHLTRVSHWEAGKQLVLPDAHSFTRLQQKMMDGYILQLIKSNVVVSAGNNQLRFTIGKAWRFSREITKGQQKVQKLLAEKMKARKYGQAAGQDHSDVPVEAEVQAFQRLLAANERRTAGMFGRILGFTLTLVVSYFAFGLVFSFNSVFILLGVILFHELGHIAAMYAFRYRDLQILFIPLLGAAALGKKDNVAVWKQVVVYLMGPLPGIIVGIALLVAGVGAQLPWVYELVFVLLVINYLNLLPILPLDGGHIVRLTVMERFPMGMVVFTAASGVLFAIAGVFSGEAIFWVLAVVTFMSVPSTIRRSSLLKALAIQDRHLDSLDFTTKLTRVFETLRQTQFSNMLYAQKFNLVKSIKDVLQQQRHCSVAAAIGMLVMYLGILVVTPAVAVISSLGPQTLPMLAHWYSGNPLTMNWDEQLAKARSDEERLQVNIRAMHFYAGNQDIGKAKNYLAQAKQQAQRLNQAEFYAQVDEATSSFYLLQEDYPQSRVYMEQAITKRLASAQQNPAVLANSYNRLAGLQQQLNDVTGQEAALIAALGYAYRIEKPEERYVTEMIIQQLLDVYYQQQHREKAELLLQDVVVRQRQNSDYLAAHLTQVAYQELGWLAADRGANNQALEQFNLALAVARQTRSQKQHDAKTADALLASQSIEPQLALAYIYYKNGDIAHARDAFAKATQLLQSMHVASLDQYLADVAADAAGAAEDPQAEESRAMARWRGIQNSYQQLATR